MKMKYLNKRISLKIERKLIHILDIILYIFVGGHIEQTDQDEDTGM